LRRGDHRVRPGQRGLPGVLRCQAPPALEFSGSEQGRGVRRTATRGVSPGARRHPRPDPARAAGAESVVMTAQTTATARCARREDTADIARIYNQGIEDRIATFETEPRTTADIERLLDERLG